jgi:hypothetical protein
MRHDEQHVIPFWLEQSGFRRTDMTVENEEYSYEVWQKRYEPGRIELGINGFGKHRPHYFVTVGPQNRNAQLKLSNFYPENQYVSRMEKGAFTYHDWDELVLTEVPGGLSGHKLLTTIRGRAREAHLINAFRSTLFPSSKKPDQILLTWSDGPATTMNIQWRTGPEVQTGVVRFKPDNSPESAYNEARAVPKVMEDRLLQNDRFIKRFTANLTDLQPNTRYRYRVGDPAAGAWSEEAVFQTGPLSPEPFAFVWFGDTHRSPRWGELLNKAFKRHPHTAFYAIAGDVVSTGLYRDEWDQLFEYSADVIKRRPLMPAIGNHDSQDGLGAWMYYDLFALPQNGPAGFIPERTYSFEYSNALFLMLDATAVKDEQAVWLEQQLEQSSAVWKFAVFHFPPYSYDEDYPDIREKWGAVFDKYHVDMVFSGHVHYYMRTKPMYQQRVVASPAEGTVYVISIGIPNRHRQMPSRDFVDVRFDGEMLYQLIEIDGNTLRYTVYNLEGEVRDMLIISK